MFGGIFKLMFDVVDGVISQIMSQIKVIEDAVTSPLRALLSEVMGGTWKGDGADRFVQEMTQEVIPMLVNIMNVNNNYSSAIRRSLDRMNQAEQTAAQQAQTLFDVFGQIF
jgi:WXG100 family type VII secretion target